VSPSQGFVIAYFDSRWSWADAVPVESEFPVVEVVFFDPTLYEELLGSSMLIQNDRTTILNGVSPWSGFGTVQVADACT